MTLHDAVAGAERAAGRQRAGERPERLLVVRRHEEQVLAPRAGGDRVEARSPRPAARRTAAARPPPGRRRSRPRASSRWRRRGARRPGSRSRAARPPARAPADHSQAMRRGWAARRLVDQPGRSTARRAPVPRTRARRLRVHIGPFRTAHGAPGSSSAPARRARARGRDPWRARGGTSARAGAPRPTPPTSPRGRVRPTRSPRRASGPVRTPRPMSSPWRTASRGILAPP